MSALGAVFTHDLELAAGAGAPDIAAAARTVHFEESLAAGPDGPRMTFDYRLHPGPATTTNACCCAKWGWSCRTARGHHRLR